MQHAVYQGVAHRVVWCDAGLPPPPGWHFGASIGGPRMSPTPRSAKYGATHGCHPLRGLIIPRLSESAARQRRLGVRQERGTRRWSGGVAASTPERVLLITTRYNGSCAGVGGYPHTCVPKVRVCSAEAFVARGVPLARTPLIVLSTPAQLPLYRVMIRHATLWLLWRCADKKEEGIKYL